MERCLKSLIYAGLAAFAVAACSGCSPSKAAGDSGVCGNVVCPTGCDISADCSTCIPESNSAGAGTACQADTDCCTGTCVNNVCTPPAGGGTSGGSSSGGSSSGGAGNVAVGQPCGSSSDCSSDYCRAEDGGSVCACNKANPTAPYSCKSNTDCCTGVVCTTGKCVAPAGGSSGGSSSGGSTGGAGTVCKAYTGSSPPAGYDAACNPDGGTGEVCTPSGSCVPNCNVVTTTCLTGETCLSTGHCTQPVSGTSSGGSTGGGSTTGGSGSSSGGTLATACTTTVDPSELTVCDGGNGSCTGGLTCVTDPNFGGPYCQYTCSTTANCPDLITLCVSGSCNINICGTADANNHTNGAYDGPCNAAGTNDGTCIPDDADGDGGAAGWGFCLQGGSITNNSAACSTGVACAANDLCSAGWLCNAAAQGDATGNCLQLCDPTTKTGCATGSTCQPQSSDVGACIPNGGGSSGGTTGGSSTGGSTGGKTSGGSSGGGTSGGTLPGDTCASCTRSACKGNTDDCVCDPNDAACANGYCAPDCTDPSSGGADQSVCTGGTQCIAVTSVFSSSFSSNNLFACYPASGTCIGAGGSCGKSGSASGRNGAACNGPSDCCSQYCPAARSQCACNPSGAGYSCTSDTDCNFSDATGGVCLQGQCEFACQTDADCCSSSSTGCVGGFCQ